MIRERVSSFFQSVIIAVERCAIWLGMVPWVVLAIARLTLSVVAAFTLRETGVTISELTRIIYFLTLGLIFWNIISLVPQFASPHVKLACQPFTLVLDLLVCLALMAAFQALEMPVLCCLLILFWVTYERLGRKVAMLFCLCLVLTLLLRSTGQPWNSVTSLPGDNSLADFVTVFVGCLVALAAVGANLRVAQIKNWGDQLEAAGGNLQSLPMAFFLQQIMEISPSPNCLAVWTTLESGQSHGLSCIAAQVEHMSPAQVEAIAALYPQLGDVTFLFGHTSRNVLLRGRRGDLRLQPAPDVMNAVSRILDMRQGYSFLINAGDIQGRVFVAASHGWSPAMISQARLIEDSSDAFFERYFFLKAWRERSFVEARYALSGDLHDSVLQTLAALRVRIATLMNTMLTLPQGQQMKELTALQELIIGEQSHLRELLNESNRHAGERENLSETLERCAGLVMRQWGIQCRAIPPSPDVQVPRATAIEVEFLIREVVANAVQHAQAERIAVSAAEQANELLLVFRDETSTEDAGDLAVRPGDSDLVQSRSISRRLATLGGKAYFDTLNRSNLLSIRIPLREKA